MIKNITALGLVLLVPAVCGCASNILSDERLRENTALVLGVELDRVAISNRQEQFPTTYYTATTKDREEYSCFTSGGNLLTFGMVNPPNCTKKGTSPSRPSSGFGR